MMFPVHTQQTQQTPPGFSQPFTESKPSWVDELFRKMDHFESKLNKLDQIDNVVTSINSKVTKLEQDFKLLDSRMNEVERGSQLISDEFDQQKSDILKLKTDFDKFSRKFNPSVVQNASVVDKISESLEDLRRENDRLKGNFLDIQMKSMRNNLVFFNVPEAEDEQCIDVIRAFCNDLLKIEDAATKLAISGAERLGKKGENVRPMLVKFCNFESRDIVKRSAKNLKDTEFGISEQLPVEIQKRRREQLPLLKELRDKDIKAYFVKDKIFVGGKEYVP